LADVGELIRSLVTLLRQIKREVRAWQKRIATSETSQTRAALASTAGNWETLYRMHAATFEKTAKFIVKLEENGCEVPGKPAFNRAWRDLRAIICFTSADVAEAMDQVRRGDVRPLDEVMNALSNKPDH
jgi:hypothetical protein